MEWEGAKTCGCSLPRDWTANTALNRNIMDLPKRNDGEVDWMTLGNILVAYSLGEVLHASYIDTKFGSPRENFNPDTNWRFSFEEKGVVVLVKEVEDSPIKCFMGRSVIDLPAKTINDAIYINENTLHWDKYAVEAKKLTSLREEPDVRDCISYLRHEAKHCLMKSERDMLFYARNQHMRDSGKYVTSVLSVEHPCCPPNPGVQRGQVGLGTGWVLEPCKDDPNRTIVTYVAHVNLIGLPNLIINRVMRRQPLCIHYLRQFLTQPPKVDSPRMFLRRFSRSRRKTRISAATTPPPSTPEPNTDKSSGHPSADIPTPDIFCDNTGYTFSALTVGSNPLYNWKTWSVSTATTTREKDLSSLNTSGDWSDREAGFRGDRRGYEESETVDFRVMSMDSTEKRSRRRPTWLPGFGASTDQRRKAQEQKQSEATQGDERGVALELSVTMSNISGSHAEDES